MEHEERDEHRYVASDGQQDRRFDPVPLSAAAALSEAAPPIRIVIADDAVLLREALAAALAASGFEIVGQAVDVAGLLALVDREQPDVAVVDVRMPPSHTTEGLEAAHRIRAAHPGTAILVLSQYVETRYAVDLLRDDPTGVGYIC
jgi:serine/threonine-protein kinase